MKNIKLILIALSPYVNNKPKNLMRKEGDMKDMRKCFLIAISVLAIAITGTGCSTTDGYIGHSIITNVQLGQANFKVVKSVTGEATADYFLMIGPSEQDLLGRAKRDMIARAKLTGSQAVVNVTTDIQEMGFLIWKQKKAYVSGDIIQFE